MKILITGVAGFIGSTLSERLLQDGFEVVGVDNFDNFYPRALKEQNLLKSKSHEAFKFIEGDIVNEALFEQLDKDIKVVVHIAAKAGVRPSIQNPEAYVDTNVKGTLNVLQYMSKSKANKLVFASSSSIYGNNKKVPFSETDVVDYPISPYAATKKCCELLNHTFHNLYDIDILNLRFFTVYGPRQRPDLAIHKFVHLISEGKEIPVYGDGTTARDYTYVDDIVDGIYKSIQYLVQNNKVYEILNIGNSSPITLSNLIQLIGKACKKEVRIKRLPMQPGDVNITFSDISKATNLIGYNPKVSMEEGLNMFVYWYNSVNVSEKI